DAEADRIERFVEDHPDPSAAHVLGAFDGHPDDEDLVAAWLDARESAAERAKRRVERLRKRRRERSNWRDER
ncbi:hypothetical protein, partial [Haloplanus natans]|uniref:hypothetical protein n=1 Tax=Haloplanus natans TaxID=376171 RepID=UPI00146F98FB